MKQFLLISAFVVNSFILIAQVSINTANTPAHNSAMLDITSTNKGLLIPRMTTSLRSAITSPAKGLMVMDTTLNSLWYYNGTTWGELSSVKANLWNSSGNHIFNTNAGNVGVGTATPNANALLHADLGASTTKGILVSGTYNDISTVPDLGEGTRMMFYPGKAAFRVGYVDGEQWNNSNVGGYSTALGENTIASGDNSLAMGSSTTASGSHSTAMGEGTTASGTYSTAMGTNTIASEYYSTAMGLRTIASGYYSTAMGETTRAAGPASTAMGITTTALGQYSTAMGGYTTAGGTYSAAIGYMTKAKGYASTVIGMYNDSLLFANQTTVTSATPLFVVGNGDNPATPSNAMVVLKNGNVGIGKGPNHEKALLHIALDTSTTKGLLVSGTFNEWTSTVPDLNAGSRMMFYPGKSAFRAGRVSGTQWDNTNVGRSSTAMGHSTTASGPASTAMGSLTIASGTSSTAMGEANIASGPGATAMGFRNMATASNSTAMGYSTTAGGSMSTAAGDATIAKGYASTVIGMYNDSLLTANETTASSTTPLFIVGNGSSSTARSNALVVRKDGTTGMGTNTPSARLHLKSNSLGNAVNSQLLLEEDGDDYTRLTMKNTSAPTRYWDMGAYNHNSNGSARLTFYYQGAGDILSLKGDGNATLMGTLTQNSDARLKKNVHHIQKALPLLMQLGGYNYNWKNETMDPALQSGVLAQEVQKVLPQLVKQNNGILSVSYSGLIPYIIEAMKEQQKQKDEHQQQLNEKQQQIDEMKARLDNLEKLLIKP